MELIKDEKFRVYGAIIEDYVKFEGAALVVSDGNAAVAYADGLYKCVFRNGRDLPEYIKKFEIAGEVCAMNMPVDAPKLCGFDAKPCKSFAYLDPMPPVPDGAYTFRRLAPTLAEYVHKVYRNPGNADVEHIARLMRDKGVFGAFVGTALAGFIGRHGDGSMGLLEVDGKFRRRGVGSALEKFLVSYVMTFGRTPFCDSFVDNAASLALQRKLGLTEAENYTFWFEKQRREPSGITIM